MNIAATEAHPATRSGGHALVIEYGDCELTASCLCGVPLGECQPHESLDSFSPLWEQHVRSLSY